MRKFLCRLQNPATVVEHMIDSRRTLDLQLRDACQKLILNCSNELTKEMNDFIQKVLKKLDDLIFYPIRIK